MRQDFHIVIAGAGVVGLTLAALLGPLRERRRLQITIVDGSAVPSFSFGEDFDLRVSAISVGSQQVLTAAGAWQLVAPDRVCRYAEMRVWDASAEADGPETLNFSAADYALPELGHIVENRMLQHALLSSLNRRGQQVLFDREIRGIAANGDRYSIALANGDSLEADLLVGADGAASLVRGESGIGVLERRYRQSAVVTHLEPALPHRNIAWQRFLPTGPVALLPLEDGRVSTVWSTTPELAEEALGMDDASFGEALSDATDFVLGRLTPSAGRAVFPLRMHHAQRYVLPGLALTGDAAHSVHPLAGQGVNLGIADADCLARILAAAIANGEDIGDYRVLRRYERERKGANRTMLYFVDGLARLFSRDNALAAALRTTGMRLFNRSGPLRDYAVGVALGLRQ